MSDDARGVKLKALAREYYEVVVSGGLVDRVPEFVAPGYTEVHEGVSYPIGIEGAKAHVTGVRRTYPDLALTVQRQFREGDWVVSCVMMQGTHAGEWLGMKPTGRLLRMSAVNVDRFSGDKLVEHGGAANLLLPLLEAGAIRVVGERE